MNAFEYAMNMELDGKKYYEELAAQMTDPAIKRIFEELAVDEQHHYEIFKALAEGKRVEYEDDFKTTILKTAKNVFQAMRDGNKDVGQFPRGVKEAWEKARDVEDKSERFYREQADATDDDSQKTIWLTIAREEHKHWAAMDNMVRFIEQPRQWLEDAEWSNLEDY